MKIVDMTHIDLMSSDLISNPYQAYSELRQAGPVCRVRARDQLILVLSRYADVSLSLKDSRFIRPDFDNNIEDAIKNMPTNIGNLIRMQSNWLPLLNPPEHTRLRNILSKSFSMKIIESLGKDIEEYAQNLFDGINSNFDLVSNYAQNIPLFTILKLLQVDFNNVNLFSEITNAIEKTLEPSFNEEELNCAGEAATLLCTHLSQSIEKKFIFPKDNFFRPFFEKYTNEHQVTINEILGTYSVIMLAGFETTKNLIAGGVYDLICNPLELEKLRKNPHLLKSAIEEMLRYETPLQHSSRILNENVNISGVTLEKNTVITSLIGSANRDEQVFVSPDKFDIERQFNPHLAFGGGIHFCLGAMLARVELYVAFGVLLQRLPNLSLVDGHTPEFQHAFAVRGLKNLLLKIK